jgi:molecular chaperone DnaK (HSP70)
VEASARYLQHVREAWNEQMAEEDEGSRIEEQRVILTVPASFDEVARELTVAAARQAGLSRVILVEEPLAAFYAWLSRHEQDWASEMQAGQLVLVCDVGGGPRISPSWPFEKARRVCGSIDSLWAIT